MFRTLSILSEVEPFNKGDFNLPPPAHMSVLSWFSIEDVNVELVIKTIREVAAEHAPLRMKVNSEEVVGEGEDIPVWVLKNTEKINKLHIAMVEAVDSLGGTLLEPQYTQADFRPYIVKQPAFSGVSIGSKFVSKRISIVEVRKPKTLEDFTVIKQMKYGTAL